MTAADTPSREALAAEFFALEYCAEKYPFSQASKAERELFLRMADIAFARLAAKPAEDGVREALEPFAEAADAWDADIWNDDDKLDPKDRRNKLLTVGDLRRARSVYVALQSPNTGAAK